MSYYRPRRGIGSLLDQNGNRLPTPHAQQPEGGLSPAHDWSAFDSAFHPAPAAPAPKAAAPALGAPAAVAPAQPKAIAQPVAMRTAPATPAPAPRPAVGMMAGAMPAAAAPTAGTAIAPPAVPAPRPAPPAVRPMASPVPDAFAPSAPAAPSVPAPALTQMTPGGQRNANGMVTPQYAEAAQARTTEAMHQIDAGRDAFATQQANSGATYRSPEPMRVTAPGRVVATPAPESTPAFGTVAVAPGMSRQVQTPYGMVAVRTGTGDGTQPTGAPGTLAAREMSGMTGGPVAATAFDTHAPVTPIGGATPAPAAPAPGGPALQGPTPSGLPLDAYATAQQQGSQQALAQQETYRKQQADQLAQETAKKQTENSRAITQQAKLDVTGRALNASMADTSARLAASGPLDPKDQALLDDVRREEEMAKRRGEAY